MDAMKEERNAMNMDDLRLPRGHSGSPHLTPTRARSIS
ncbi:uncharacterized protein FFB20_12808 [Fusarium fujikuroi]|nr:uncharacterized protein FFE2_00610 [Fusarium fujikuroi]SCN69612.1 uncharacterized protein FFC1_00607 [Fusarium fujikuroi]SCN73062.1 uncharacterized protein FFM5_00570 [Fusarium fujikuroi]SCO07278.1 uncharacterized protein FFB20_12808 [Fusarium fujikuroi]SCO28911.1 uncharacterized protein FFNC_00610 [Fusarium fujikuroi]